MRRLKSHIFSLLAIVTALLCSHEVRAEVIVHNSVDSVTVEMGDRTMMRVEVLTDGEDGTVVGLPQKGQEIQGVEFLEISSDRTELGNGRSQLTYEILLQAFEPQLVTLPRIGYAIGTDTAFAEVLTLNVRPVDLDTLTTINKIEGTVSVKSKWYDALPDWVADYWLWIILAIVAIAAGWVVYKLYKKNGNTLIPRRKPVPPYEKAMNELERLRQANLPQKGHIKEYYTRLIDILREYLMKRYGIYALEMTSSQILAAIKEHPEASQARAELKQLFQVADFVKFAKVLPPPDDNVRSFNVVKEFIEETKPVEPEEENDADADEKGVAPEPN